MLNLREEAAASHAASLESFRNDYSPVKTVCSTLAAITTLWRVYDTGAGLQTKTQACTALLPICTASDTPKALLDLLSAVTKGLPAYVDDAYASTSNPANDGMVEIPEFNANFDTLLMPR